MVRPLIKMCFVFCFCVFISCASGTSLFAEYLEPKIISQVEYQKQGGFSPIKIEGIIVSEYPNGYELWRYKKMLNHSKEDFERIVPLSKAQYEKLWKELEAKGIWALKESNRNRSKTDLPTYIIRARKESKRYEVSQYGSSSEFDAIISILERLSDEVEAKPVL